MKPFNLEEYLANPSLKIVTREGKDARIICTDAKGKYPIVALIKSQNIEYPSIFTKKGKYVLHMQHPDDLFFASEKYEGWLNIYRSESGFYLRGNPYKSKEEADEVAKANPKTFFTTIKIEWEE